MARDALIITRRGAYFGGRSFARVVGRGGITAHKREGDGATPEGHHHIVGMLYRPDRIAAASLPGWARGIGTRDLWSDDPDDPNYNLPVRAPHPYSHEALRRADPLYDLVLVTDWNHPLARPGLGSAIFVHRWRGPGRATAGCVAFAAADLLWIARRIRLGAGVIVRG